MSEHQWGGGHSGIYTCLRCPAQARNSFRGWRPTKYGRWKWHRRALIPPCAGAPRKTRLEALEEFARYFAAMECMGCKRNRAQYRDGKCTACRAREALGMEGS